MTQEQNKLVTMKSLLFAIVQGLSLILVGAGLLLIGTWPPIGLLVLALFFPAVAPFLLVVLTFVLVRHVESQQNKTNQERAEEIEETHTDRTAA